MLCITFMMFVHVWPYPEKILTAQVGPGFHLFYSLLINELGRASVPLLSVISGFLFFSKAAKTEWQQVVADKARTLLVPMILWSAVLLAVQITKALMIVPDRAFFDVSLLDWLNRIFAITAQPANIPLAFLRDVFVCCCIALVASALNRKAPNLGTAFLLAAVPSEILTGGFLLLRPQIFLFFSAGYFIAQNRPASLAPPWTPVVIVLLVDIALRLNIVDVSLDSDSAADVFHRMSVAMLMWSISFSIARGPTNLAEFFYRREPIIFVVFCGHGLVFAVLAAFLSRAGIAVSYLFFPLVLVAQIILAFLAAGAFRQLGSRHMPRLYRLLSADADRPRGAMSVMAPGRV